MYILKTIVLLCHPPRVKVVSKKKLTRMVHWFQQRYAFCFFLFCFKENLLKHFKLYKVWIYFLSRKIQCLACNENTTSNVGERNPKLLPFVDKQPEPVRGDLK